MTQSATVQERQEGMGSTQLSLNIADQAMVIMERKNGELIFGTNPSDIKTIHVLTPLVTDGVVKQEGHEINYTCSLIPQILPDQELSLYVRQIPDSLKTKIFDKAVMRLPQLIHQLHDNGTVYDEQSTSYENRDYQLNYEYKLR